MGAKKWTTSELVILEECVTRFLDPNNTETGETLIRRIMEKTGRPESGTRSKFYHEVARKREEKESNARAALGDAAMELTSITITCRIAEVIQELNDLAKEIRTLEQWAQDTLNIKKRLEYNVDPQGVVERLNKTQK